MVSKQVGRALLVLFGIIVFGASTALAGSGAAGPNVAVSGTSPFAACTADNVTGQIGTNFPNSEVEPWVEVSSVDRNGDGVSDAIGAYQQDRWSNGGARGIVASVLYAGTWRQVVIPGVTKCSGGAFDRATDPWVAISPNGDAYVMTLTFQDYPTFSTSILYVNKSIDGGLTWGPPIQLIRTDSLFMFNDKNSMTADPFDSNYVYGIWDRSRFPSDKRELHSLSGFPRSIRSDAIFVRTTNGGVSWEPARPIFEPKANQFGIGHQIEVVRGGPHAGRLVNSFMLFHGSGSNKKGQEIAVLISDDRGTTWSNPITVRKVLPGFVSDPDDGTPLRTGDIIPELGAGPAGELYIVWQEASLAPSGSAIALSKSVDGGTTWSEPVRVNTRPDVQAFTPSVEVLGDGTVGVTHYDLRFNTLDPATLPTDYWFLHSHDGGGTWLETRVTPASFDSKLAPFARGLFLGDYLGLTTAGSQFLTMFTKTEATDPASQFATSLTP
ncbi:MAG: exo-alpha-sialidase [Gemmatimonadetes bacterium]|nr:exo-alpha-sialidase [Gemmatimonadota bacterium]